MATVTVTDVRTVKWEPLDVDPDSGRAVVRRSGNLDFVGLSGAADWTDGSFTVNGLSFRPRNDHFVKASREFQRAAFLRMDSRDWNTLGQVLIQHLSNVFKRTNYWRVAGPRLRLVNKHWRSSVDALGIHVSVKKLPDFPHCRQIPPAIRNSRVASLSVYPQYGRVCKLPALVQRLDLSRLHTLWLCTVENGDATLSDAVPFASTLRRLKLHRVVLHSAGFEALSEFTLLTCLGLENVNIRGECIPNAEAPARLTKLRSLSVVDCLWCTQLSFFAALTALEFAEVVSDGVWLDGVESVSQCARLASLSLCLSPVEGYNLDFISGMSHLTALRVCQEARLALGRLSTLRRLALKSRLSGGVKTALEWIPNRDAIVRCSGLQIGSHGPRLTWTRQYGDTISVISELHALSSLDLAGYPMDSQDMELLASLPYLRELRHHNSPDPLRIQYSRSASVYQNLELWTVDIDWPKAGSFAAKTMPVLKSLGIFIGLPPSADVLCLHGLSKIQQLERINITGTPPRDSSFWEAFQSSLEECSSLKHIGWRRRSEQSSPMPADVCAYLTQRGIVFDEDYSVFVGTPADC